MLGSSGPRVTLHTPTSSFASFGAGADPSQSPVSVTSDAFGARMLRRQPLFAGEPAELSASNFDRHLTQSQIPLLVDFWAPWCGPCRMMAPAFAKAAGLIEPRLRLAKVNTEDESGLGARFGIRSIPTLVLFAEGRELARQSGALTSAEQIARWAASQFSH